MKSTFFLVCLLVGVSHGFLGSINQAINNVGNTVGSVTNEVNNSINTATNLFNQSVDKFVSDLRGHVENFLREVSTAMDGVYMAFESIWEEIFNPVLDALTTGSNSFLNDKFGAIAAIIGRPITVPANPLSEKYAELIARLKSNIHHLYEQLFEVGREGLSPMEHAGLSLEEHIQAYYDKIEAIHQQINEWTAEAKKELEAHANVIPGDWANIINQYSQNLDLSAKAISALFQELAHSLMRDLIDFTLSFVPNAAQAVQNLKDQGLLSFLHQ